MQNSILTNLLNTFSENEFREFGFFVESPFYNRRKVLVKLYNLFRAHFDEIKSGNFSKEFIFAKLFPGKKYNDALMRNTVSDFLKLSESFLMQLKLDTDGFRRMYLLMQQLTDRKQKALFKKHFKKWEQMLTHSEIRDEIFYQNTFIVEDERRRNIFVESSKGLYKNDNLGEQARILNIQHLTENIKLYAILLNQMKYIYDHKFDLTFFENVREYIQKNYEKFRHITYIAIYYNCVMLFKTEERKYFENLKKELRKNYKKLTLTDRKNMYTVLTNYCYSLVRKGIDAEKENFIILKDYLRTKAYLEGNDFMGHTVYIAIVQNAIDVGEMKWAEKFIYKYKDEVHRDFRDNVFNFVLCILEMEKKSFDKALSYLSKVELYDDSAKLNVNRTLLMIYFSKNEIESFNFLVDSFRHFIKRNKVIRAMDKLQYNNYINYINKLHKQNNLTGRRDKSEIKLIRNQLEIDQEVVSKKWLMKKIDEILDS